MIAINNYQCDNPGTRKFLPVASHLAQLTGGAA